MASKSNSPNNTFTSKQQFDILYQSMCSDDIEDLVCHLEVGYNPNSTNEEGANLLMIAVNKRSIELVRLLLDYGADPNVRPFYWTPLEQAKRDKERGIQELLKKYGANEFVP